VLRVSGNVLVFRGKRGYVI
jgi:transposase